MPDPIRFRTIDEKSRSDHYHLVEDDWCFYLMEYTPGQRYDFGEANNLISNLKKSPLLRNERQYFYKNRDMRRCTTMLQAALRAEWLPTGTIVPMPPSKTRDHPEYDDRMSIICRGIRHEGRPVDVRDLIRQKVSTDAAHTSGSNRPTLQDLINNYEVVETLATPIPASILIIDDMLTAGSHFKAAQHHLNLRFPNVRVQGAFITRRVPR